MSPRVLDAIQAFTPNAVATAGGPAAPGSPPPYTFSPLRLGGQGTECDLCGYHAVHLWTCASCHTQGHEQCLLPQLIAGFPFCSQCAPVAQAAYERHTHATRQRWQLSISRQMHTWRSGIMSTVGILENVGFAAGSATAAVAAGTAAVVRGAITGVQAAASSGSDALTSPRALPAPTAQQRPEDFPDSLANGDVNGVTSLQAQTAEPTMARPALPAEQFQSASDLMNGGLEFASSFGFGENSPGTRAARADLTMEDLSPVPSLGFVAGTEPSVRHVQHAGEDTRNPFCTEVVTEPSVRHVQHEGEDGRPQNYEKSPREANLVCIACEPGDANQGIPHLLLGHL